MDVLHGTLSTYELRIKGDKSEIKEATFQVAKQEKKHENQVYSNYDE